jgi:cell division protein FtsB
MPERTGPRPILQDRGEILMKKGKATIGIFILLVIFLYLSYIAVNQQKLIHAKNLELSRLENKIAEEMKINEELKKQNEMIESDEYIERIAREKLGMVRKNERVYVDIGN